MNDENMIQENSHLDYFFEGDKKLNKEQVFHVLEGKELEIVIADFSLSDTGFHLIVFLEENCSAIVKLASVCSHSFNKKYIVDIVHNGKKSFSRTTMSGINSGNGQLRFLGNSTILNGASKSDTRQEGRITNLSENAVSEVSPALLIKENDVKASHGAALGAYNPDSVFYLMSRGLSLQESKKLITIGNIYPIIESLKDETIVKEAKKYLEALDL